MSDIFLMVQDSYPFTQHEISHCSCYKYRDRALLIALVYARRVLSLGRCGSFWLCLAVYRLYLDQTRVNLPVTDAFEPGKPLLRGFDRPLTGARRSNEDRALAAAEKLFVPGNFVDESHAIVLHPASSHSVRRTLFAAVTN